MPSSITNNNDEDEREKKKKGSLRGVLLWVLVTLSPEKCVLGLAGSEMSEFGHAAGFRGQ